MTWTKLGDEFADLADQARLSDAAVRTHTEALIWSNRRLLDLMVPKRDLKRALFSPECNAAIAELVTAGWWQDCGDTFWIGGVHAEWQRTRDQVESERAKWQRATKHKRGDHSMCKPEQCKALSSDDTPDDNSDESSRAPGRDGSGRDGHLDEQPPDEAQDRNEYTGGSVSWTPEVVNG